MQRLLDFFDPASPYTGEVTIFTNQTRILPIKIIFDKKFLYNRNIILFGH